MVKPAHHKDPIGDALAAVTAGIPPKADEASVKAHADHIAKQSTVDNKPAEPVNPLKAALAGPTPAERKLPEGRLRPVGYLHNHWDVTAERQTTIDDLLRADFWVHTARYFKPLDQITAFSEDGSWYARFIITACDRLWAKVVLLEHKDLTAANDKLPRTQEEDYDCTWSAIGKFAIVKKDQTNVGPIKDGFQTRLEAYTWLDQHLKTING